MPSAGAVTDILADLRPHETGQITVERGLQHRRNDAAARQQICGGLTRPGEQACVLRAAFARRNRCSGLRWTRRFRGVCAPASCDLGGILDPRRQGRFTGQPAALVEALLIRCQPFHDRIKLRAHPRRSSVRGGLWCRVCGGVALLRGLFRIALFGRGALPKPVAPAVHVARCELRRALGRAGAVDGQQVATARSHEDDGQYPQHEDRPGQGDALEAHLVCLTTSISSITIPNGFSASMAGSETVRRPRVTVAVNLSVLVTRPLLRLRVFSVHSANQL